MHRPARRRLLRSSPFRAWVASIQVDMGNSRQYRPFPMWLALATAFVAVLLAKPAPLAANGTIPAPLEIERAFPSVVFADPVHLTSARDGTDRIWVVERRGTIQVFLNDWGATATTVFLDIRSRVLDAGGEEGLLGLAFDPSYASNGHFFAYYSADSPRRSVISRFSVGAGDPYVADPSSELVILEVPQPFSNHNGGTIAFGTGGHLYISLGDGAAREATRWTMPSAPPRSWDRY